MDLLILVDDLAALCAWLGVGVRLRLRLRLRRRLRRRLRVRLRVRLRRRLRRRLRVRVSAHCAELLDLRGCGH